MNSILRLMAVGLLLLTLIWGGGSLAPHVDSTAVFLVFGLVFMSSFAWFSWAQLSSAIQAGLKNDPLDPADASQHVAVLRTARQLAHGAGFIGFVLGMHVMLNAISDPVSMGPGCAVALLSCLYAAVLSELFFGPLMSAATRRAAEP